MINTSTPQNKAVEWLAYRDPAGLDLDNTLASNLRERYIVALLYFATSGDEWSKRLNFLSNFSVCDWNDGDIGVFCIDPQTNLTDVAAGVTQIFIGK